jgi:DNA-sulfur modification-associated
MASVIPEVSGYDTEDRFYATRYTQGGRRVYSIDLSLAQIAALLPEPDPHHPAEGNRRVREGHARAFADYVREKADWVSPALVLRAPDMFKFDVLQEISGTEFGILSVPRLARTDLKILDGQHRILGVHLGIDGIAKDLERERAALAAARRNGDDAVVHQFEAQIRRLEEQRSRLGRERISIQIFVEEDPIGYKQMFYDIADNALGITSSVRARFDNRKIVHRCVEAVVQHALLKDRVDLEQDRIGRGNPNLVGAKHVAEIIRTVAVGIDGRVGKRLEDELSESALVHNTNRYLDVLLEAFPVLASVADRELEPEALRQGNLLGSTTMLRVLAGVYHDLVSDESWQDEDVAEYFSRLAPHLTGPVSDASIWIDHVPGGIFAVGSMAPTARRQDLKRLTDTLRSWALQRPDWLYVDE